MKLQAAARLHANVEPEALVEEALDHFKVQPDDQDDGYVLFEIRGLGEVEVEERKGQVLISVSYDSSLVEMAGAVGESAQGPNFKAALRDLKAKMDKTAAELAKSATELEKQWKKTKQAADSFSKSIKAI